MPDGMSLDRANIMDADLFGEVKREPGRYFVEWSRKSPFYIMVAGMPQAVLTRYEDQKPALEDFERFSSVKRKWPGTEKFNYYRGLPVITDNDPPAQIRLRRLMAPIFSARKLAAMEASIQEFVAARLQDIAERGTAFDALTDLGHHVAAFTLFGQCLGLDPDIWSIFIRISRGMAAFNTLAPGAPPPPDYLAAWDEGYAYCTQMIEDRRRNPKNDVIGTIVVAGDQEGKVSTEEMFATMLVLFTAGFGGIQNTAAFTLWRLCRDPSQLTLVQSDLSLMPSAIAESIRLDTNAWSILRWATHDFEYNGLQIYGNMPVHFMCSAPNFNPDMFPDPMKFDVTRKAPDLMSFGHGFHHCIGSLLAKMAARITVQQTIVKFPDLRLQDPDYVPEIVGGPKERGPHAMPMVG